MTAKHPGPPTQTERRHSTFSLPAPANDGPALDARAEAAVDAAVAATVPALRAHLRRELAERLPHLRAEAPARRERIGLRPGDDAPVDDTARARARALLTRHTAPRVRR